MQLAGLLSSRLKWKLAPFNVVDSKCHTESNALRNATVASNYQSTRNATIAACLFSIFKIILFCFAIAIVDLGVDDIFHFPKLHLEIFSERQFPGHCSYFRKDVRMLLAI